MVSFEDVARRLGGTLIKQTPLVGGVSARVTSVELAVSEGDTRRVVVREPGAAAWKEAAAKNARREFELLSQLLDAGLPVPRPLLLEDHPLHPFFVMEFVDGTRDLPADGAVQMADMLARVHGVSLSDALHLPDREDPGTSLPEFLGPDHDALRSRLLQRPIVLTPRRTLLHGDYWPGNVLWRDGTIVALLDWEDAAVGDPLSDVACCRLELRYVLGAAGAAAFTSRYAQHTQSLEELPVWDAYVAAAALSAMGQWGLPKEREALMRREATVSLAEAKAQLLSVSI